MTKKELFDKLPTPDINARILVLTHTDLDGSGCNLLLKSVFKNVTTKYCSNGIMSYEIKNAVCNPEVSKDYDYIFATDISCKEADAEKIQNNPNHSKLIILDHHGSANDLNQYKWACIQSELVEDSFRKDLYPIHANGLSSGTSLVYDYLDYKGYLDNSASDDKSNLMKEFVHIVASYDTWDWVNVFGNEKKFNDMAVIFDIYRSEYFEQTMLEKWNLGKSNFNENDEFLLKIEKIRIDAYLENVQKGYHTGNLHINDKWYSTVFCCSDKYMSETFEHMKTTYPDYDVYMINYGSGLSFRATKSDINIGEIMKPLGGGGHAGAGGIKIEINNQVELIEKTLNSNLYIDEN